MMQNQAAEIKLRAERRAGEMLKEAPKNEGSKGQLIGPGVIGGSTMQPPSYADLGIEKTQAMRWQLEAEIPEEKFERRHAGILQCLPGQNKRPESHCSDDFMVSHSLSTSGRARAVRVGASLAPGIRAAQQTVRLC
ncbi:MAG: hypothetical protein HY665_04050 [Chloroflexi bacterium]|nr:hypothetical protein [Chloroflexota bacterium]